MKRFSFLFVVCLVLCLAFVGCGKDQAKESAKLRIVATNFALYDFASSIVGQDAEVVMLLPPATESHSFEPTPRDMRTVQNSQVFIYNGGESDAWVEKMLKSLSGKRQLVRAMDCVRLVKEEIKEGMTAKAEGDEYDEHVWTSPRNALLIAEKISLSCAEADKAHGANYAKRYKDYAAHLTRLDQRFTTLCQGAKRRTVIFGDRFPLKYFVDAYGLNYYAAFPGCAENTEPNAQTIAFLIQKVREEKIPVVFSTELSNERVATVIAESTGAKKRTFHACHNVSRIDFEKGVTYIELMERNEKALQEALN